MSTQWKETSDPALLATMPLVSVHMITYNHGAFLAEAIEGVAMQKTDVPIELVIGVDVSSDNTLDVALRYQKLYPHLVRVREAGTRIGAFANMCETYNACRGKYLAICEGDDFWTDPEKLAKQIEILDVNPAAAGSFHDCYVLDQASGARRRRVGDRAIDPEPGLASVIRENNIATGSMVFRNVIPPAELGNWLLRTAKGDYMLALLVARRGTWRYLNHPMSVYRVHAGGIWSGASEVERFNHNIQFWELLENSSAYADAAAVIKARRRNDVRGLSIALARDGRLLESSRAYLRSLGSRRALHGRHFSSSKYFKALARYITARLGMQELADGIWRKTFGHKETRL